MSFRYEIRLSGDVGHGLLMVGKILAEAAAIYDGQNAIQSQSYGEEARGESNRSDVVIMDTDIIYPKVEKPDILLCLTQSAYNKHGQSLKPDSILIIDSSKVLHIDQIHEKVYDFPIFLMAREQFGDESLSGIISLGIVAELIGIISQRAIHQALMSRIPRGTERINEKALKLGYHMAQQEKQEAALDMED